MLKKYEKLALDNYLKDYPQDKTFIDLMNMVVEKHLLITPYPRYEKWDNETLCDSIHHLALKMRMMYGEN